MGLVNPAAAMHCNITSPLKQAISVAACILAGGLLSAWTIFGGVTSAVIVWALSPGLVLADFWLSGRDHQPLFLVISLIVNWAVYSTCLWLLLCLVSAIRRRRPWGGR